MEHLRQTPHKRAPRGTPLTLSLTPNLLEDVDWLSRVRSPPGGVSKGRGAGGGRGSAPLMMGSGPTPFPLHHGPQLLLLSSSEQQRQVSPGSGVPSPSGARGGHRAWTGHREEVRPPGRTQRGPQSATTAKPRRRKGRWQEPHNAGPGLSHKGRPVRAGVGRGHLGPARSSDRHGLLKRDGGTEPHTLKWA